MNIPGVEVLNKTELMDYSPNDTAIFIAIIAVVVAVISFLVSWCIQEEAGMIISLVAAFVAVTALFIGNFAFPDKTPTGYYKYEVLIDDSVNLNQICNDYEIIDTRGKIYIIKNRKNEAPANTENESTTNAERCVNCQTFLRKEDRFCPSCGKCREE